MPEEKLSKAVVKVIEPLGALITPDQLRNQTIVELEKRNIVKEFVQSQLVAEVDYGIIPIGGNKKKNLLKPGMEKIFSLLSIRAEITKDEETVSMLSKPDIICYRCFLYRGEQLIAEGRGACGLAEKRGDANTAIKIAEKRAKMDACLSLGFSEYFTQDLEDIALEAPRQSAVARQEAAPTYHTVATAVKEYVSQGEPKVSDDAPKPLMTDATFSWADMSSWVEGSIYDVEMYVMSVEKVDLPNGKKLLRLHTNYQEVTVWSNNFLKFKYGSQHWHKVALEYKQFNGKPSCSLVRHYSRINNVGDVLPAEEVTTHDEWDLSTVNAVMKETNG